MESHFRKKIIMIGAAVVIVLVAAIIFLVSQSNRIIKQRLEQTLGENFAVKSLSLSWDRIEVSEPRIMKDGQIAAQAKRIILKTEILALLKPGFPISSVVLEEPSLTLQIDKSGQWVVPFVIGKQPEIPSTSNYGPLSVQKIEIKEGMLFFQDHRRPEPNSTELRKINLTLDRVAYPLKDEPSTFAFQAQLAGNLVSGSVSGSGTINLDTLAVNGQFEGQDLIVLAGDAAEPVARAQRVSITAASKGTAAKGLLLSDLVLVKPYLRLETDRKGKIISPLTGGLPKARTKEREGTSTPVEVKNLKIEDGELLYIDGKVTRRSKPNRIELRKINLTLDHVAYPLKDEPSTFAFQAQLAGNLVSGSASGSGTINLDTLAVNGKFEGQNLTVLDGRAPEQATRAQSASFTAVSKGAAAKDLLLSNLVLTKPYLRLETDRKGKIISPLTGGLPKARTKEREGTSTPVEVKNLKIEDGELLYIDGKVTRRSKPNRIELRKINLTLDHVAYPLKDEPSTVAFQAQLAGNLVSGSASGSGTINLDTLAVNGKFEGQNLTVLDGRAPEPAARVQSASFTAVSKGAAAKDLLLSDLLLIKPYLRLETDRKGKIISPLTGGLPKARTKEKEGTSTPVEVKNLRIEDGEVLYLDGKVTRRSKPNRIELRKINLTLDHVAYPLKDEPSTVAFQAQLAGNLVSGSVSGSGTINLDTLAVNGKFEGQNLTVLDGRAPEPAARVQSASFTAVSKGAAAKDLLLSNLVLTKPYLRLETNRKGKIISPLWIGSEEKKGLSTPVEVKNLRIDDGEVLYLDGKVAQQPYPVSITGIDLTADQLSFPFGSQNTAFRLSVHLPGNQSTGVLTSSGNTALKTLDTNAKVSLRDLDLTSHKPYMIKEGEDDISRGFFDLDMDIGIKKRMLYAPAHSVLRDLQIVGGSGLTDQFLGLPRDLVVKALQTNNNQISLDFIVEGSLDNPTFSLREIMIARLTVGLAKNLGLSVIETGAKVIIKGSGILKGVGDAVTQPFK